MPIRIPSRVGLHFCILFHTLQAVSAFGQLFGELIEATKLDQKQFAKKVGEDYPFLNNIVRGHRSPPLDRVEKWSAALGLDKAEGKRFYYLACIAHVPKEGQATMVKLVETIEDLGKSQRQISDGLKALQEALQEVGGQIRRLEVRVGDLESGNPRRSSGRRKTTQS